MRSDRGAKNLRRPHAPPTLAPVRSWFVIPAMGVASGVAAVALGATPAMALTGAAIAAVIRVIDGETPAALVAAVLAPLLAVASLTGVAPRAALALAAAGWTITELAREDGSPLVALLPAGIAALLDPSFVALPAIAGTRWLLAPGLRPRWALAVPAAGVLAILVAVLAGARLGWFATPAHPVHPATLAARLGEALGPLTAVAALAGLFSLVRPTLAMLALAAALVGALLVDLRAGTPGAATIGLAALLSGLAIHRLAALIRLPAGQAITGATIGVLVILPPAWTAIAERAPAAHIGHASR